MSNKKKPELKLTEEEATPALTKKQKEKEEKRIKDYQNSMITRLEASELSRRISTNITNQLADFLREPMRDSMVQTMALTELLKAKGIIENDEELQKYIEEVYKKLQALGEEVSEKKEKTEE